MLVVAADAVVLIMDVHLTAVPIVVTVMVIVVIAVTAIVVTAMVIVVIAVTAIVVTAMVVVATVVTAIVDIVAVVHTMVVSMVIHVAVLLAAVVNRLVNYSKSPVYWRGIFCIFNGGLTNFKKIFKIPNEGYNTNKRIKHEKIVVYSMLACWYLFFHACRSILLSFVSSA